MTGAGGPDASGCLMTGSATGGRVTIIGGPTSGVGMGLGVGVVFGFGREMSLGLAAGRAVVVGFGTEPPVPVVGGGVVTGFGITAGLLGARVILGVVAFLMVCGSPCLLVS
jgi:hypothetical protein